MSAIVCISMNFAFDAKDDLDRVMTILRQALHQSQSEVVVFLLFVLTYFAGFAKARRWSVRSRFTPKVMSPRASGNTTFPKVTAGPTKATAVKINLPTTRRFEESDADKHLIKAIDKECLPTDGPRFSQLVSACVRLGNTEVTLHLFDHMLESGVACDPELIRCGTAGKFFKLVAASFDDARMRACGVQLMRTIEAHGLWPTNEVQNQLIRSWKSKLPGHVVEVFVSMRERGLQLSATAYRCVMAAHERDQPVFTLRLYDEMLQRGMKVDRVAFNAVLCACSHLGMSSQALVLFEQMPKFGLVPNGKTYGTLIRVCTRAGKLDEALELLESMRAAGIEPNRFAFRDAIHCCVKLKKFDEAYELYQDLVEASAIPCNNTCMYIMEACLKNACLSVAERIQADMGTMGQNGVFRVEIVKDSADAVDSDTE